MFPEELDDKVEDVEILDIEPTEKTQVENTEKVEVEIKKKELEIKGLGEKIPSGYELYYKVAIKENKTILSPFPLREVKEFDLEDQKLKEKNVVQWLIPLCLILNIFLVVLSWGLGLWQPFLLSLTLNGLFIIMFFIAGENFWMWIAHFIFKKKNWGIKIFSRLSGRDELHFGTIKETEVFKYKDESGKKRVAPVNTTKLRYFSNLGSPYAIYREGYMNSIDLQEEYPVSKINRDANQAMMGGITAGFLLAADELVSVLKKNQPQIILLIMLAVVAFLAFAAAYFGYQNNPEAMAKAIADALGTGVATGGQVINVPPAG